MSKKIPHRSKTKPNDYTMKLELAAQSQLSRARHVLFQMAHDAAAIAGNEYMGLANTRLADFLTMFHGTLIEIMKLTLEDGADDRAIEYTKHKVDTRLAAILGEYFEPWDKRYGDSN